MNKIAIIFLILAYILFVCFGLSFETSMESYFNNGFNFMNSFPSQTTSVPSYDLPQPDDTLSEYLRLFGYGVYTDEEFESFSGTRMFSNPPKMTLLAYMLSEEPDVIAWYDGKKGYVCFDLNNLLTSREPGSMSSAFIDVCNLRSFDIYIASLNGKTLGYAPNSNTMADYSNQTGKHLDTVYKTKEDYIEAIRKG